MAGRKQHYIPLHLLRGFEASRSGKKSQVVVYKRGAGSGNSVFDPLRPDADGIVNGRFIIIKLPVGYFGGLAGSSSAKAEVQIIADEGLLFAS